MHFVGLSLFNTRSHCGCLSFWKLLIFRCLFCLLSLLWNFLIWLHPTLSDRWNQPSFIVILLFENSGFRQIDMLGNEEKRKKQTFS